MRTQPAEYQLPLGVSVESKTDFNVPKKPTTHKKKSMVSYPVKTKKKKTTVAIPSGSYVKASLMTGVRSPEGKLLPSLLVLEEAYTSPNSSGVDLSGCFALAKTQASMSTERIEFQVYKLSCVSPDGKMIERKINGFVVDGKDQGFAVQGELQSNQSRVATMAFMNSIVNGIGEIITRKAQNIGGGNPDSNRNVIVQQGATGAANQVAQWYLNQANNLAATLNVPAGGSVYVVMNDKFTIPKSFFNSRKKGGSSENMGLIDRLVK